MLIIFNAIMPKNWIPSLKQIQQGVYAVLPWWGAGGTHLFPFQSLIAQKNPVSIWILLRPWMLDELMTNVSG